MSNNVQIELQTQVEVNGEIWKLYPFYYKFNDLTYSSYLYARNDDEAGQFVSALRQTSSLDIDQVMQS